MHIFKNIFSNLATAFFEPDETFISSSNQLFDNNLAFSLAFEIFDIDSQIAAKFKSSKKKKAKDKSLSRRLNKEPGKKTLRLLTLLLIAMKLIRPNKQKVKVLATIIDSTLSKHMH